MASRSFTQLMDLPNEMLDHLSKFLGQGSLCSFAAAHPRLQAVCQSLSSLERIRSNNITGSLLQFVSARASEVRSLDHSDCWSGSESMRTLIGNCRNVSELNVVNSSLTLQDLLEVVPELKELKDLSVTISENSGNSCLGLYPSIRELYVEFAPSDDVMDSVVRLLEACPGVTYLHLNPIGYSREPASTESVSLSAERLSGYRTLILSTELLSRSQQLRSRVFSRILKNDTFLNHFLQFNVAVNHCCWFERENFDEEGVELGTMPGTLSHSYPVHYIYGDEFEFPDSFSEGQIGLRVYSHRRGLRMPSLKTLSALTELDFSKLHFEFSPESWQSLVETSPAVCALALPNCSLFATTEGNPVVSEGILEALSKLELKTLCIEARDPECDDCLDRKLSGLFVKFLSSFKSLEELTLNGVEVEEDLFELVEEPCSLKSVKLSLYNEPSLRRLGDFLSLCKDLKKFKLESFDLSVDSPSLWEALSAVQLKQLCLSSSGARPIDVDMLEANLPKLFSSLDVFHLHAIRIPNAEEVRCALEHGAREANLHRGINPVIFVGPEEPSVSNIKGLSMARFPGRSFCSLRNFAGRVKPISWVTSD